MTDTGQVPGEGLPENAGGQPERPDEPVPGAYTFAGPVEGVTASDEDDLLLPGSQGAWSESSSTTQHTPHPTAPASGRYGPTGTPGPAAQQSAPSAQQSTHVQVPHSTPTPPRPLHLGPPVPEQSGAVRSLADRGPTPVAPSAPVGPPHTPPQGVPVRQPGPPTTGPEYFEVAHEEPQAPAPDARVDVPVDAEGRTPLPGQRTGTLPSEPVQADAWAPQAPAPAHGPAPDQAGVPTPAPAEATQWPAGPLPGPDLAAIPVPEGGEDGAVPAAEVPAEVPAAEVPAAEPVAPAPQESVPAPVEETPAAVEAPVETTEAAVPAEGATAPADAFPVPEAPEPAGAEEVAPAPEQQLAMTSVPGAGPQVMEAVAIPAGTPDESVEAAPDPEPEAPEPEAPDASADAVPPAQAPTAEPATGGAPAQGEPAEPAEPGAPESGTTGESGGRDAPDASVPRDGQDGAAVRDESASDGEPATAQPDHGPAPGYDEAERETLHRLMRERRDIRNGFRSDPIPHEVLLRVLEAAHTAPSVGHSQPWDFVIIRSEETRRTMHELAMRQREAYAESLPKARARQFKELKVEAILDTPVNIVVTADPTRGGRHTLGRHTQPQMAPYSSALAVENLWLAARAEGLGVGWVSFFDEREMVRVLGLPEHLEVVAYLCIGYVDAFPEEPELVQAGWSKRRPLSWVVHEESYGRRVLPGAEEPHDLLTETLSGIRPLDAKALGEAWERQKRMTKPSGALGMLEIISAQLSGLARQCPPPIPEPAAVAVFAGDHGVHAQGVTPWPQEVTAQMVANFLAGGAVCNAFANQVGAEVCVVDVGVAGELPSTPGLLPRKVRAGTADFTAGPALTREEVLRAVEVGIETARDLVAAGNKALLTGEMGIANTTVSAALISVFTGADPSEVTGRGTGVNDETHAHKVDVVRRALETHRPDPSDPLGVLAAVGGLEHAAMTGLILGGASLRTPVILDGVSAGAAALVARAIAPEALAACIAGHRSAEPGHVAALTKLGLRPLIDLDLRLGEGTGALLALPVVQSAARAMHEVATFDSAGVTEKA